MSQEDRFKKILENAEKLNPQVNNQTRYNNIISNANLLIDRRNTKPKTVTQSLQEKLQRIKTNAMAQTNTSTLQQFIQQNKAKTQNNKVSNTNKIDMTNLTPEQRSKLEAIQKETNPYKMQSLSQALVNTGKVNKEQADRIVQQKLEADKEASFANLTKKFANSSIGNTPGGQVVTGALDMIENAPQLLNRAMRGIDTGIASIGQEVVSTQKYLDTLKDRTGTFGKVVAVAQGDTRYLTTKQEERNNFYNTVLGGIKDYKDINNEANAEDQRIVERNSNNWIAPKVSELTPSLANNVAAMTLRTVNPALGGAYFFLSAAGSYDDDAQEKGMNEDQAFIYRHIMAGFEEATEAGISSQRIKGFKKILEGEGIVNAAKRFGLEIGENFLQEGVMPGLSELTSLLVGGTDKLKYDYSKPLFKKGSTQIGGINVPTFKLNKNSGWYDLLNDSWSDAVDGALSEILLGGLTNGVPSAISVVNKMQNGEKYTSQDITRAVQDCKNAGSNNEEILRNYVIASALNQINEQQTTQKQDDLKGKSFEDIVDEAMSNYEYEEVKSPLQNRNIETIGKEKVNAYQYDNPEVKPYFQEMAQMLGEDIGNVASKDNRSTIKGGGTSLNTNIAAVKQLHEMGYSYNQIADGLTDIIEDNGKENNAISKKLEIIIDDQLRNGYINSYGKYVNPNEEYINLINKYTNTPSLNQQQQISQTENKNGLNQNVEAQNLDNAGIKQKVKEFLEKNNIDMTTDEFINWASNKQLEQEKIIDTQQQDLYNLIKDVQDKNSLKEEVVDYDNGLWYNDKGIEFSNKFYEDQLDSAIRTDTPNLEPNKLYTKEFGDNFYLFEKTADNKYNKYLQLKIEGNEDIINYLEEVVKSGQLTDVQKVYGNFSEYWNRNSDSDGINGSNEKQKGQNGQSNSVYREKSELNTGSDSKTGNENSNVKDNKGRTLTKQQQEYFKDSAIRTKVINGWNTISKDGDLFEAYHGTNSDDFTVFDKNMIGSANDVGWYGKGFYFAFTEGEAKSYGQNVLKAYLNIKNPFNFSKEMQSYDGVLSGDVNFDLGAFFLNLNEKFPEIAKNETIRAEKRTDNSNQNYYSDEINAKDIPISQIANEIKDIYTSPDLKIVEIDDNGKTKYAYAYSENINNYDVSKDIKDLIIKSGIQNLGDATFAKDYMTYYEKRGITKQDVDKLIDFFKNNDVDFRTDIFGFEVDNKEQLKEMKLGEATHYVLDRMYSYVDRHMPEVYMQSFGDKITEELKKRGYDGVIQSDKGDEIVAFYPNQIKSIDNKNPTSSSDILKEEYQQLEIDGFNKEPENNLSKENWKQYQESKKKTNKVLEDSGTEIKIEKRKFSKDFIDNGYIDLNGKVIKSAVDIADISQIFRNPKYETFRVIYMQGNTIVGQEAVSSKIPNQTNIFVKGDSQAKGFYKIKNRMERLKADGYYLLHNHPTGIAQASNADVETTKIIDKNVKGFRGHIIINSGTYALIEKSKVPSFENSLVWKDNIKIDNYSPDAVDKMMSNDAWTNIKTKSADDILNLAYDLKNNPNYSSLILSDAKQNPRIVLDIPNSFLNMNLSQIEGYIKNVARQNGAMHAYIATQNTNVFEKMKLSNHLVDCVLYSVTEDGTLQAKQGGNRHNSIFHSYDSMALRTNEKIEDIYSELLNKQKQILPTKENMQKYSVSNQDNTNSPQGKNVNQNNGINLPPPKTKKTLNPTEISNLKEENANTTPKLPKKNTERGNKQSSFLGNILNDAQFLDEDLRQEIASDEGFRYYKGITNEETLAKAFNELKEDGEAGTMNWFNQDSKKASAKDTVKGWILLKQYQDKGDYQSAVQVAKKMREIGTNAGQTVQAFNILSRLTPEGMVYYAQSELSEAYNEMVKNKSKAWIDKNASNFDLTPQETQQIIDIMEEVGKMEDGYDKRVKLAEVQKIITDKIPPSKGQGIKAWMRISMLFNPKTQVRNVMGNAVILPVNTFSDILSTGIDKAISKKTGVRTTSLPNVKQYAKGFGKGIYESYNDFRKGINTRNIEGNRFEIGEGKSFKDKGLGKALNKVDNLLSFALDVGDRGFYEATFTNSINNQLVANKTDVVTQEMIDIATQEALQRTWQDNNGYTQSVLNIRRILNKVGTKGYGLGDVLIPFAKTPANLTKAIVDYSPVGLTKTLTKDAIAFNRSLENGQYSAALQHKFVQDLGKGMAGTTLYVLAYALAKAGIATGEPDDDKDVKNFMKNSLGISSYSIKIGDKSYTYDWAQPVAVPLAVMTNYVKYSKDNPDASAIEKAIQSANIGTDQLLEQSFMKSLNTVLNGNGTFMENLGQAALELPARAIPTFSKQIADMVDPIQRTSFEYKKPVQSAVNSVKAKIPGLSKTLPASVDTLGNTIMKYGGENNAFNVFLNPANVNKGELSKAGQEIYDIYKQTGDASVLPQTAPYYINSGGDRINMDAEQRLEFQTVMGQYVEDTVNDLLKSSSYRKLSNDSKSKIISEVVSDSYSKAKKDVLNISGNYDKTEKTIKEAGASNYYLYKNQTQGLKKDSEKIEKLVSMDMSDSKKSALYVNTVGSDDDLYNKVMTYSGININEYLKYKEQNFSADKVDDGTEKGKSVSGSKKAKVYDYVNNMNVTGKQRMLLLGTQYKLTNSERQALANYVQSLNITNTQRKEIYSKLQGFTVYKDGRVTY